MSNNPDQSNPALIKPTLNSATLSKALTRPPPLNALLTNPSKNINGSLSTANSSLSPSPSILQQQNQPLIGSNLIAQSKKSLELSNQSLNNSMQNLSLNNLSSLNNSLSSGSTSQLFSNQLPNASNLFQNLPQPQSLNKSLTQLTTQNSTQNGPLLGPASTNQVRYSPAPTGQSLGPPQINGPPSNSFPIAPNQSPFPSNQGQLAPPLNTAPRTTGPPVGQPAQFQQQPVPTGPPTGSFMNAPTVGQMNGGLKNTPFQGPSLSGPPISTSQFQAGPPLGPPQVIGAPVNPPQFQTGPPLGPPIGQSINQPSFQNGPPLRPMMAQNQPTAIGQPMNPPQFQTGPPLGPSMGLNQGPPTQNISQINGGIPNAQFQQNKPTGPPTGPPLGGQFYPPPPSNEQYQNAQQYAPGQQPLMNRIPQNQQPLQTQQQQQQQPLQHQQLNNPQMRNQPNALDLLREKKLIHPYEDEDNDIPRPLFPHEFYTQVNCHSDTIRCTLSSIPESQQLLSKSRLPLGILIHPFKDLESLKVVQSSIIVRCRNCRSYINPFVHFLDNSKWRCNMCYSINDLPEEFLFDPVTRSYGDPSKRPEINSSTIEFIAPPEYTLRPPPPAMYLYLLDVSHNAINTGYLQNFCETLSENLDKIPGNSRAQIGFITYSNSIHFYNLSDQLSQPKMMIYPDLEELQLPMPDGLMVNLNENRECIQQFLQSLPSLFTDTYETDSALGTALTAGFQLLKTTGGRMTIMQTCLPNIGVGGLKQRDDNIDKDASNLAPQTDFYKKLALDCAGAQVAVDLFMLNSLNADLATLSCVSKYSGGEVKFYPGYHPEHHPEQVIKYSSDLKRYLTRKIGFEAVMRIRCTRGMAIHTFHGNFFVRSTDLLALPNVNPDAGFGMQVNIEESLSDIPNVCFQAAVLYTSSKSERRIRIHTYCLPVTKNMNEIVNGADQEAIIGLISKMAVDRTAMNSLKDARDAMVNVAIDYLQAYGQHVTSHRTGSLISPYSLRLVPLYVIALLKHMAFKFGNHKMDERVYAMNLCKTLPLRYLMLTIYPNLYAVHNLDDKKVITDAEDIDIYIPPRLHLSSENIDRHGLYVMDCGDAIYMWVGRSISDIYLNQVFDVKSFGELPEVLHDLPELENELSEKVRQFIAYLYDSRPFGIKFLCFKEGSHHSSLFFQHLFDDKTESSISYYEFLKHLSDQINN